MGDLGIAREYLQAESPQEPCKSTQQHPNQPQLQEICTVVAIRTSAPATYGRPKWNQLHAQSTPSEPDIAAASTQCDRRGVREAATQQVDERLKHPQPVARPVATEEQLDPEHRFPF